ncbi:MAG: hypothetical protein JW876_04915 [Candidatus Krumholzibacteriota bacterium]|nr:hypothetical protein [Candidatus Krumholzibacteriota bacterium]
MMKITQRFSSTVLAFMGADIWRIIAGAGQARFGVEHPSLSIGPMIM